mmetsp:Transcript_46814/g.109215  ORF Transcript_46814/g.109215 Transcript_46814/m.109215 type:complete len:235 (-) Transcript_46814:1569-2273(-)
MICPGAMWRTRQIAPTHSSPALAAVIGTIACPLGTPLPPLQRQQHVNHRPLQSMAAIARGLGLMAMTLSSAVPIRLTMNFHGATWRMAQHVKGLSRQVRMVTIGTTASHTHRTALSSHQSSSRSLQQPLPQPGALPSANHQSAQKVNLKKVAGYLMMAIAQQHALCQIAMEFATVDWVSGSKPGILSSARSASSRSAHVPSLVTLTSCRLTAPWRTDMDLELWWTCMPMVTIGW